MDDEAAAAGSLHAGALPAPSPAGVATRRAYEKMYGTLPLVLPVLTAALALLAWEVVVKAAGINPSILPPPSAIMERLLGLYPLILHHAVPTSVETLMAFGISVPLGILLAIAMVQSKLVNWALYPNLIFFQLIPKIALAPLFIVWLGIGAPSRVSFAVFVCFFPIMIATAAGLQSIDRDLLRLCRSVLATDMQIMLHVRLPHSVPYIFSGMKVSVTLAIIGIVVGEFIASQAGLGYLILFASSRQQTDVSMACIVVLCIVGLALYGVVEIGEILVKRWYGS
jgi:NitT/TauT family transport system permease protein